MQVEILNSPYRAFLGHEGCKSGHRFGPAIREYFLLHFVIRGKGRLYTQQGEYTLEKGDGFFLSPGEVTTYVADQDNPWEYVWVGVGATNETEEILRRHGLEPGAAAFPSRRSRCPVAFTISVIFPKLTKIGISNHPQNTPLKASDFERCIFIFTPFIECKSVLGCRL